MDSFGFTRKKLTSLSIEGQHKHMIKTLSGFYQKLTTNRVNPASCELFAHQYNQVLTWAGMTKFIKPESNELRKWIEAVSDRIHHHRTALGQSVRDYDLFEKVQTKDRVLSSGQKNIDCHVALDGLRSLFNVGSIFRTCEAAGFNSVILGNVPGKDHPRVRKTAMGAQDWIEQEKVNDLASALVEKKAEGFHIVGVETIAGARPFHEIPWEKKTILVFGNEEYGISSHVMKACDTFIHIPMFGKKNSINVANAAAVICFQVATALCGR